MNFLKKLCPAVYAKSVYEVDYAKLRSRGISGLIFDIDGTLVPHGMPPEPETEALFEMLRRENFDIVLLTDNDRNRAEAFASAVGVKFVCDAEKPKENGYLEALKIIGREKDETAVVGDRLFKDIAGANGCGITSVFVGYRKKDGERRIGKSRMLEKLLIRLFVSTGMLADSSKR